MPADFIAINKTGASQKYGTKLERFISMLREVRDLGEEVVGVLNHNAADPNYTGVENTFGTGTGNGQTVYNLAVASYARVNHADITNLVDRVG